MICHFARRNRVARAYTSMKQCNFPSASQMGMITLLAGRSISVFQNGLCVPRRRVGEFCCDLATRPSAAISQSQPRAHTRNIKESNCRLRGPEPVSCPTSSKQPDTSTRRYVRDGDTGAESRHHHTVTEPLPLTPMQE